MTSMAGATGPIPDNAAHGDLRPLRVVLVLQAFFGLLWGISMLFFARQIELGETSGQHIEKIAIEGAAHMMLVFGAILVWRNPYQSKSALQMMIFLNALWVITDLVYIPLLGLSDLDFYAKVIVNAVLAVGLFFTGRRAGLI